MVSMPLLDISTMTCFSYACYREFVESCSMVGMYFKHVW